MKITVIIFLLLIVIFSVYPEELLDSFNKAEFYLDKGGYEQAVLNYERFISSTQGVSRFKDYYEQAKYNLGLSFLKMNAKQNAMLAFRGYLEEYPEGKFKQEAHASLQSLVIDKAFSDIRHNLLEGYFTAADKLCGIVLEIDPGNKEALEYRQQAQKLIEEAKDKRPQGYSYCRGEWVKFPIQERDVYDTTAEDNLILLYSRYYSGYRILILK